MMHYTNRRILYLLYNSIAFDFYLSGYPSDLQLRPCIQKVDLVKHSQNAAESVIINTNPNKLSLVLGLVLTNSIYFTSNKSTVICICWIQKLAIQKPLGASEMGFGNSSY